MEKLLVIAQLYTLRSNMGALEHASFIIPSYISCRSLTHIYEYWKEGSVSLFSERDRACYAPVTLASFCIVSFRRHLRALWQYCQPSVVLFSLLFYMQVWKSMEGCSVAVGAQLWAAAEPKVFLQDGIFNPYRCSYESVRKIRCRAASCGKLDLLPEDALKLMKNVVSIDVSHNPGISHLPKALLLLDGLEHLDVRGCAFTEATAYLMSAAGLNFENVLIDDSAFESFKMERKRYKSYDALPMNPSFWDIANDLVEYLDLSRRRVEEDDPTLQKSGILRTCAI